MKVFSLCSVDNLIRIRDLLHPHEETSTLKIHASYQDKLKQCKIKHTLVSDMCACNHAPGI